jgi:spore germination protein
MGKHITNQIKMMSIILLCLILSACMNPGDNILEEIAPAILYYFDEGEEKKLRVTTMVPPVKKEKRAVLTSEENLIKETKKTLNSKYYREVKDGQLRLTFFSTEIAKKGIENIIDSLYLDTEISDRIFLGLVEGDFEGFLKDPKNELVDYQLYREMKHNKVININYARDMHQYLKASYNPNADPFLPLFKVSEDKSMKYSGLVLFKNHKQIGDLSLNEEKIFRLLHQEVKFYEDITFDSLDVSLSMVGANKSYKIDTQKNTLAIQLDIACYVNEYQGKLDLTRTPDQLKLKKQIEGLIKEESTKLLKKLQEKEVDPLAIGKNKRQLMEAQTKEKEWNKVWKDLNISIDISLKIKDYGTFTPDKNF